MNSSNIDLLFHEKRLDLFKRIANNPKNLAFSRIVKFSKFTSDLSVHKMVWKFERAGLIIMKKAKRRYNIILTPKGKEILKLMDKIIKEIG